MNTIPRTIQNFDSDWMFHLGDLPIMHAVKAGMTGGLTDCEQINTDIVRYGNEGKNVIFVKVDASDYEGWWYEGAGFTAMYG